ncbi:hypothetical protein NKR23_g12143 [Pleurostoma richardsiae]|uniref:Uncharacterized protein n=1 Tax=Pleurostoma richardsiae TaxID=41990 RepID=A0AA38R8S1_9PEZI|nr:hypothetical protein NKR23_g12143 [Pleurostoma richardsiae]
MPPKEFERSLALGLVRPDAALFFADHCEEIYRSWVTLLHKTALPCDGTCMDRRVQAAFEAVDDAIAGDESGPLLSRLAHAWLPQMLASLREIIRRNRRDGAVFSTVGRGDATIALNIYLRTQRRASILAGRSLLLLVTYSDKTETLIRNTYITNETLKTIAQEIQRACPAELIYAAAELEEAGRLEVNSGTAYDVRPIKDALMKFALGLDASRVLQDFTALN